MKHKDTWPSGGKARLKLAGPSYVGHTERAYVIGRFDSLTATRIPRADADAPREGGRVYSQGQQADKDDPGRVGVVLHRQLRGRGDVVVPRLRCTRDPSHCARERSAHHLGAALCRRAACRRGHRGAGTATAVVHGQQKTRLERAPSPDHVHGAPALPQGGSYVATSGPRLCGGGGHKHRTMRARATGTQHRSQQGKTRGDGPYNAAQLSPSKHMARC
jgi:hypothetical protein